MIFSIGPFVGNTKCDKKFYSVVDKNNEEIGQVLAASWDSAMEKAKEKYFEPPPHNVKEILE